MTVENGRQQQQHEFRLQVFPPVQECAKQQRNTTIEAQILPTHLKAFNLTANPSGLFATGLLDAFEVACKDNQTAFSSEMN